MDYLIWGGPVYCNTLNSVEWERPTTIICKPAAGSTANAALYHGFDELFVHGEPESIGLSGFSAFHGFATAALRAEEQRVNYLHLADACFLGAGATQPNAAFARFAQRAVMGEVRMTITTNGPWGKDIHYEYEGTKYNLTSGAKCVDLFWQLVTEGRQVDLPPEVPGLPAATKAFRCGELYWWHYETGGHEWHANKLAAPIIQALGASWMGGGHVTGPAGESGSRWLLAAVAGLIGIGTYLLWRKR